jgi:hypothetical protein
MPSKGQQDLDQYIFTRPEMAKLLGISTNALRCRMRKGKCDLEYRFDGNQFKFKRLPKDRVNTMMADHPKTPHEKEIHDYNNKVQKKYNRGATHKGKANYPNNAFELHNQMKILNSINGKFKSEEHRKRFENLNDKALEKIDKDIQKENERRAEPKYHSRPKYGGMVYGYSAKQWDRPYDLDRRPRPNGSFHITGKPYYELGKREEEKEEITYTWDEPRSKDTGADYKPGRFKHLDEAIRNSKKD